LSWYCDVAPGHPLHGPYHDNEYGFPLRSDPELFERLVLEINQAGLSWLTILRKKDDFHRAFHGFDVDRVARYGERDRQRLLNDASIIRNRLKVDAAIDNARRIQEIRDEYGSFADWLDAHHPLSREEWTTLFKKTFRFTGGEIVNEFLMSLGYLPGAHRDDCPVMKRIAKTNPPWMQAPRQAAGKAPRRAAGKKSGKTDRDRG
jgi:DNA-3-methyladenine glycosylase I